MVAFQIDNVEASSVQPMRRSMTRRLDARDRDSRPRVTTVPLSLAALGQKSRPWQVIERIDVSRFPPRDADNQRVPAQTRRARLPLPAAPKCLCPTPALLSPMMAIRGSALPSPARCARQIAFRPGMDRSYCRKTISLVPASHSGITTALQFIRQSSRLDQLSA
jgi:hypothetical protein